MSRSSTKLLSGETSSAGTPATSSMISPRPVRISSSVIGIGCVFSFVVVGLFRRQELPGARAGLGDRDHLRGVADARAEAEQKDRVARADLAALDHGRQ